MSGDRYISSVHIDKLGHKIEEIRERALYNIISKLEHGFIYDNELARSKEILIKLLAWFKFENHPSEHVVLNLIKRILQAECGGMLIDLFRSDVLQSELMKIKGAVNDKNHVVIDDILALICNQSSKVMVPHLNLRGLNTDRTNSTATPIEGFIIKSASISNQFENKSETDSSLLESVDSIIEAPSMCLPHYVLMWQRLVGPDQSVLESVEKSLRNPKQPHAVLHSCEFFIEILLHDFPAEVFLQRPAIVMCLHDLLWSSPSSRITTSVLNCLEKLCKSLKTRLFYYKDPCTHNLKEYIESANASVTSTNISSKNNQYKDEETVALMKNQMSMPQFALNTIQSVCEYLYMAPNEMAEHHFQRKKCQIGINTSLTLLNNSIELLLLCINPQIWIIKSNRTITSLVKRLNEILIKFATTLDHFRLEVISSDWNPEARIIYLHLLINFMKLINKTFPIDKYNLLPRQVKNALTSSILDPALSRIYPHTHQSLLIIVNEFDDNAFQIDSTHKYKVLNDINASLSAAVDFLKNFKSNTTLKNIQLAKDSLISLEFHQDINFIRLFIELCTNKITLNTYEEDVLDKIDDVLVCLLSHNNELIKEETYRICHKKIMATIGTKLNVSKMSAPGTQILFILRHKVLTEIALHGLNDIKVDKLAEDMFVHIIKCKLLVMDAIWLVAISALIPVLPILCCYLMKSTLGRALLHILDPDKGRGLLIPTQILIKTNCALLFSKDGVVREEAVSRLGWLLSTQDNYTKYLPHLNNLHDRALGVITLLKSCVDLNRCKNLQHFYQASSLRQVIELVEARNVEPIIRRSAFTQISVILEDPLLHCTFIEAGGVEMIIKTMDSALIEDQYNDYPDSVIACVTILKHLVLYNATVRHDLSLEPNIYYLILRALFMFCTEERMKQDGSILLFTLIYNAQIQGSPLKNDFALAHTIQSALSIPFQCKTHSIASCNKLPQLIELNDKWGLNTLQIHWNIDWFGGLNNLLNWDEINYNSTAFADLLKINANDLKAIKSSSCLFSIRNNLAQIINASSHAELIEVVNVLSNLINLFNLLDLQALDYNEICELDWELSFERYLCTLPSSIEDNLMLAHLFKFFERLLIIYKHDASCWIVDKLFDSCIPDLLAIEEQEADVKFMKVALLNLITSICVRFTQFQAKPKLIVIIVEHLQFNDAQHFYNLAYLDCLLCALVHLTADLGWKLAKNAIINQLITGLCELIITFHCGKGDVACDSLMGMSITRNALLILNHILGEMQACTQTSDWDKCFISDDGDDVRLLNIFSLWESRDLIVRAGILHLLAGVALSPRAALILMRRFSNLWELCLGILLNHEEASVVKENATMLLTNLTSHTKSTTAGFTLLINSTNQMSGEKNDRILKLLEEYNLFKGLVHILTHLYTEKTICFQTYNFETKQNEYNLQETYRNQDLIFASKRSSSSSLNHDFGRFVATPGFIKAIAMFINNMILFAPQEICDALLDEGLIKLFFRCLCEPSSEQTLETKQDMTSYCEIMQMNSAICCMLSRAVQQNTACLTTICNTRDCLNMMLSLLNPSLYHISEPHLLYLRNQLWAAIFNLISAILKQPNLNFEAINLIDKQEPFVQTLCESISAQTNTHLQLAALNSITSLLAHESTLGVMLDTVKTPRDDDSSDENTPHSYIKSGRLCGGGDAISVDLMAGAELCKILLGLYELATLKQIIVDKKGVEKQSCILNTLSTLLCVSHEAKMYALRHNLMPLLMRQVRDVHLSLSLESVDYLRRIADKRRICPVLDELDALLGLCTNFMHANAEIKYAAAKLGLADLLHKLWVWFNVQKQLLLVALRLLCTFTADCPMACQSLAFTSPVAGSGPRKGGNVSLLHALCALVCKEMDLVSKTHDLQTLRLCFQILEGCVEIVECRVALIKSNILQSLTRLHPAMTKRQKPWDLVELVWLEFLNVFTRHVEGQGCVAKLSEVFELVLILASNSNQRAHNRQLALEVLRNVAFYQPNRARLVTSDEFINVLDSKLTQGSTHERNVAVSIMWTLAANNQKAKIVIKCAHLDAKLQEMLTLIQLSGGIDVGGVTYIEPQDLERMQIVLRLLKDGASGR